MAMKWMPSLQECNSFSSSLLLLLFRYLPRVCFHSFLLFVLRFVYWQLLLVLKSQLILMVQLWLLEQSIYNNWLYVCQERHDKAFCCIITSNPSQFTTDSASGSSCSRTPVSLYFKSSVWPLQSPDLLFTTTINLSFFTNARYMNHYSYFINL